jgi:branched-chain amino acid transport system permease protein
LFASRQGFVNPDTFTLQLSFLFVAMVVIGGSGNLVGVAVGAILLTYMPERLRTVEFLDSWAINPVEWRTFVFGVLLVVIMVWRPQGLVPSRRRARELADRKKEAEVLNV